MMETTKELSLVDRGTFRAWRIANIAGWGFLALVGAGFLRLSAEVGAGLVSRSLSDVYQRGQYVSYSLTVGLASTALIGLAVGSIVGGRAYRWPGIVAGCVSVLYLALTYVIEIEAAIPDRVDRWIVIGPMVLVVPLASWIARAVWFGRPRALRAGA